MLYTKKQVDRNGRKRGKVRRRLWMSGVTRRIKPGRVGKDG